MDKMKFEFVLWHGVLLKKKITSFPLKQTFFFSEKDSSSILLSRLSSILVHVSEISQSLKKSNVLLHKRQNISSFWGENDYNIYK